MYNAFKDCKLKSSNLVGFYHTLYGTELRESLVQMRFILSETECPSFSKTEIRLLKTTEILRHYEFVNVFTSASNEQTGGLQISCVSTVYYHVCDLETYNIFISILLMHMTRGIQRCSLYKTHGATSPTSESETTAWHNHCVSNL